MIDCYRQKPMDVVGSVSPLHNHVGKVVAGRKIIEFAGREPGKGSRIGKPLWSWVCEQCGQPGAKPARWENLQQLDRLGVRNCKLCSTGRRKLILIGLKSQNLVCTGSCRSSSNTSGTPKREVPCRCLECGKEGWWQKTNFLAGKANCNCHRKVQGGLSNTRVGIMWAAARKRAADRGLKFTITHDDIHIPEFCPILGIRLEHAKADQQSRKGEGGFHDSSPTLDRLIPELGYTKENCWVISWRANRIKGDASIDELRQLVSALETRLAAASL
jgi:hypothetical protein